MRPCGVVACLLCYSIMNVTVTCCGAEDSKFEMFQGRNEQDMEEV